MKHGNYVEQYVGNYRSERVHRLRAERALGRPIPKGGHVHHVDGDTWNPAARLVLCEDTSYHWLLERRTKALRACGHADWLWCGLCRQYDAPANLKLMSWAKQGNRQHVVRHAKCHRDYARLRYWQRKREQERRAGW